MQSKFEIVRPWLKQILNTIKRDIKSDYLPADKTFCKIHFNSRPINRLTPNEIYAAFEKELLAGNPTLEEWVINRWVFQHGDLYDFFADKLSAISEDFDQIQELSEAQSGEILNGSENFSPVDVYLFAALNGVVFPEAVFDRLQKGAEEAQRAFDREEAEKMEKESLEQVIERQQREIARLNDKYEAKLTGVLRKYAIDVEALKKQIRSLQQKRSV